MLEVAKQVPGRSADELDAVREHLALCRFASRLAISRGILTGRMPVLDVGCGNPYLGMWKVLWNAKAWRGRYVGIDVKIPADAVQVWHRRQKAGKDNNIILRQCPIDFTEHHDRLPLPPTKKIPFKQVGVAFLVNTLQRVKNREALIQDLKRVAGCVVVVNGAKEQDFRGWDFQEIGAHTGVGEYGIWLDLRAESIRRARDRKPDTVMGIFDKGRKGNLPVQLGVCQHCGHVDLSGKSTFGCTNCGKRNDVRRRA